MQSPYMIVLLSCRVHIWLVFCHAEYIYDCFFVMHSPYMNVFLSCRVHIWLFFFVMQSPYMIVFVMQSPYMIVFLSCRVHIWMFLVMQSPYMIVFVMQSPYMIVFCHSPYMIVFLSCRVNVGLICWHRQNYIMTVCLYYYRADWLSYALYTAPTGIFGCHANPNRNSCYLCKNTISLLWVYEEDPYIAELCLV